MSITREITVWCDECGIWERFNLDDKRCPSVARARKRLLNLGWKYLSDDDKDFCAKCTARKVNHDQETKNTNDARRDGGGRAPTP